LISISHYSSKKFEGGQANMQNAVIKLSLEDRMFEKKSYVESPTLKEQINLVLGEKKICGKAQIEIKLKNKSIIKTEFHKEEEWGVITHDSYSMSAFLFSQMESVKVLNSSVEKFTHEEV
jgi:hypothetical protein